MSQSETADRHRLYQLAVQDVGAEIDFVDQTYRELRGRPATSLREDFCGTAQTACEWVSRRDENIAHGLDLDAEVMDWGVQNNIKTLSAGQQQRIFLHNQDVRAPFPEPVEIILAMNFSYYLIMDRQEMLAYFRQVRNSLSDDGIFFLDAYGGYDAPREIEETRECDGFTYVWEQASFDPITSAMQCNIHFRFDDGSEMKRAFSYFWRLWTLPEIQEILSEAGFSRVAVYWEGTDEASGEGDGIYTPQTNGDADPGWVCYLVAEK